MKESKLNEVKKEVQKILDKYLEPEQRFSIQDFDEEATFLIIDLLTEKDDIEKEKIWYRIKKNIDTCEMQINLNYESVMEINDKLQMQKNEISNLDDLKKGVELDEILDNQINNI